jgi:hypothetical protein
VKVVEYGRRFGQEVSDRFQEGTPKWQQFLTTALAQWEAFTTQRKPINSFIQPLLLAVGNSIAQYNCRDMTGRAIHGAHVDERPGFPTICGDHSRRFNQTSFGNLHQSNQETPRMKLNVAGAVLGDIREDDVAN